MLDAALVASALALCIAGMGFLALAMKVHWHQVRGADAQSVTTAKLLRILGFVSLTLSFFVCLATDHISQAALVWIMMLAASAIAIALTLNWRPVWLAWLIAWARAERAPPG